MPRLPTATATRLAGLQAAGKLGLCPLLTDFTNEIGNRRLLNLADQGKRRQIEQVDLTESGQNSAAILSPRGNFLQRVVFGSRSFAGCGGKFFLEALDLLFQVLKSFWSDRLFAGAGRFA